MRVVIFSLLLVLLFAPFTFAQEFNAGFVQGLWYSQDEIFVGDSVRIYVAIRNNTGSDLTGTIEFFDNDKLLGRKNVQALNGRIIESWMDWEPEYGEHTLKATISRIELNNIGSNIQTGSVVSSLAEDIIFVEYNPNNEEDETNTEEQNEETDETSDEDSEQSSVEQNDSQTTSNSSQGLERFLTVGPAENALSSVTNYIEVAKENLDEYRQSRTNRAEETEETASTATTTNGFGEVTRSVNQESAEADNVWTHNFTLWDFIESVWKLALVIFNGVYTFILASLSWLLGYPILVQLGILALILLLLIKLAHKFGRRPKPKKFL